MSSYHKYLTNQGYLIDKNSIPIELANEIKDHDLKFKPNVIKSLQPMIKTNQFTTYKESKNYIFVPRYYGINKLGMPTKNLMSNGIEMDEKCKLSNKFTLKSHQINAYNNTIKQLDEQGGGILSVYCGWGKCLGINTPILMYDNSIKYVQNIKKNDTIVGYNGQPRKIISISNGYDYMYKIVPNKRNFKSFTCNTDHILSVIYIGSDFNNLGFNNNQIYDITINDIINYPFSIRKHLFLYKINSYDQIKLNINCHQIGFDMVRDDKYTKLKSRVNYDIVKNINNVDQIKQILSGIKLGKIMHDHFIFQKPKIKEIYSAFKKILEFKHEFSANLNCTEITQFDIIPTQKLEQYFGFTLDQDGRFLLGDLTVTHNTYMAINIALKYHGKTLIVVHTDILVEQWSNEIMTFTDNNAKIGLIQQNHINVDNNDFVIAMLPSLSIRNYDSKVFDDFRMLIIDECHHIGSEVFSKALPKMVFKYTLGLSATPYRKDGLTNVFTNYLGPIYHVEKRSNRNDTLVIRFKCTSKNSDHYKPIYFKNGTINTMSMLMELTKYKQRNELISEIIKYIYTSVDSTGSVRKTLILSKFREHLTLIYNYINNTNLSLNNHKITVGFYWGLKSEKKTKCIGIQMDSVSNKISHCSKYSMDNEHFCITHLYMKYYNSLEFSDLIKCLTNKCYNLVDNTIDTYCSKCQKTSNKSDNVSQKIKHKMMLEDTKECDIILGTNNIASEALNIPGLNTLIQLTPQKDVEQSVGRILRKQVCNDGIRPLIFDIIDNCGNFIKHSQNRHKTYSSEGFRISEIIKIDLDQPLNSVNWDQITKLIQSQNNSTSTDQDDEISDTTSSDDKNTNTAEHGVCYLS